MNEIETEAFVMATRTGKTQVVRSAHAGTDSEQQGIAWLVAAVLVVAATVLVWRLLFGHPETVTLFSNDGPLGTVMADECRYPGNTLAVWQCNNWLGDTTPPVIGVSAGIRAVFLMDRIREWDKADWLGATHGFLCCLFVASIILTSAFKKEPL